MKSKANLLAKVSQKINFKIHARDLWAWFDCFTKVICSFIKGLPPIHSLMGTMNCMRSLKFSAVWNYPLFPQSSTTRHWHRGLPASHGSLAALAGALFEMPVYAWSKTIGRVQSQKLTDLGARNHACGASCVTLSTRFNWHDSCRLRTWLPLHIGFPHFLTIETELILCQISWTSPYWTRNSSGGESTDWWRKLRLVILFGTHSVSLFCQKSLFLNHWCASTLQRESQSHHTITSKWGLSSISWSEFHRTFNSRQHDSGNQTVRCLQRIREIVASEFPER
jgi:hypothetical protein